jgi:hypothetical protein
VVVARKEGLEEGLHTQMEVRPNPYDDFDEIGMGPGDKTFDVIKA